MDPQGIHKGNQYSGRNKVVTWSEELLRKLQERRRQSSQNSTGHG